MAGFNYNSFKEAVRRIELEKFAELERDINQVKAFVEKALTLSLESSANVARMNYPGVEL
jgi:hypothetical protein